MKKFEKFIQNKNEDMNKMYVTTVKFSDSNLLESSSKFQIISVEFRGVMLIGIEIQTFAEISD